MGCMAQLGRGKREVWLLSPQQAPDKSISVILWCILWRVLPTANLPPPTPIKEESQAHYSGQLANGLGVPLSLFMAHLALVRWRCHVHSGIMSLGGGLTDRRDESGVGALGIDSTLLASVLMCGCMRLFFLIWRGVQVEMTRQRDNNKVAVSFIELLRRGHVLHLSSNMVMCGHTHGVNLRGLHDTPSCQTVGGRECWLVMHTVWYLCVAAAAAAFLAFNNRDKFGLL